MGSMGFTVAGILDLFILLVEQVLMFPGVLS